MDLSAYNDATLAKLWHDAHEAIEDMEKALNASAPYITAKAVIEEIKRVATQRLQDSGANSIATPFGTIHTVSKTTARIMDPELFRDFVTSTHAWDMLDWKAKMSSCRDYAREHKAPVPGVELSTFNRLSITSPKGPKRTDADAE